MFNFVNQTDWAWATYSLQWIDSIESWVCDKLVSHCITEKIHSVRVGWWYIFEMFHGLIHNNGHPEQAIIVQTQNNHFFRTSHMNTVALLTSFFSKAQGKMCGTGTCIPASNNDGSCLTENCEAESGYFSAAEKHTTHAGICVIEIIFWWQLYVLLKWNCQTM